MKRSNKVTKTKILNLFLFGIPNQHDSMYCFDNDAKIAERKKENSFRKYSANKSK